MAPTARSSDAGDAQAQALAQLGPAIERLRELDAAWCALESAAEGRRAEVEAAQSAAQGSLDTLRRIKGVPDPEILLVLRTEIDRYAHQVRRAAFETSIHDLRATLPAALRANRGDLLALLDLIAEDAFDAGDGIAAKLGAVDYLVTLLSTGGDRLVRVAPHDPVTLTPKFEALCARAEVECEDKLPELESAFFSSANFASDLDDQRELHALRARKVRLGRSYFAPNMLRAVVTYNVTLEFFRVSESWDETDWVVGDESRPAEDSDSLFDSKVLAALLAALQDRLAGVPEESDAVHRVARALDVGSLAPAERTVLTKGKLDRGDLRPAIVLVGLLRRASSVLEVELQELGIEPDRIAGEWTRELDMLVKREVNQSIAGTGYRLACELSKLRNDHLAPNGLPGAARRLPPTPVKAPKALPAPVAAPRRSAREQAREFTREALEDQTRPRAPRRAQPADEGRSWRRVVAVALLGCGALAFALHAGGVVDLTGRGLDRWSRGELVAVSDLLERGHRNGSGAGAAFVGTLGERWDALPAAERAAAAREIVDALRESGVQRVMLYGPDRELRVQALGGDLRVRGAHGAIEALATASPSEPPPPVR